MYLKPENKRTITFTNCVNRPTLFPRINKINLNKILIFFPPMNCFTSSHKGFHCNFLDNHTHELYDVMVKYDWLFLPKAIIQSESDQKQNSMTFSYLVFFIFPYHLFVCWWVSLQGMYLNVWMNIADLFESRIGAQLQIRWCHCKKLATS